MKNRIENDQRTGEHTYQLFQANCVNYALSIAELAGIALPSTLPIFDLLIKSDRMGKSVGEYLSDEPELDTKWTVKSKNICKKLITRIWASFFNCFAVLFGAGMVDEEVKEIKDSHLFLFPVNNDFIKIQFLYVYF